MMRHPSNAWIGLDGTAPLTDDGGWLIPHPTDVGLPGEWIIHSTLSLKNKVSKDKDFGLSIRPI